MPGILPMKVIKVGNSAQSRIAQACDRCRSKKIRCDGTRPTCSQCANVGFECRTSDKLSRRAFPRGYTESLEERVRALETEVAELKDLLDEKDEKIELLSKMHGMRKGSCVSDQRSDGMVSSPHASSPRSPMSVRRDTPAVKEDSFRVQASPLLLGVENSDSFSMGPSSGRSFIETFKRRIQESGKPCGDFNPEAFLHIQGTQPLTKDPSFDDTSNVPPRLFSDKCVNIYFQEWAPLFPILHKPTFLRSYEDFIADPEKLKSTHKLTQLHLVLSIAGISAPNPDLPQLAKCEGQWSKALEGMAMDNTMQTLQCLLLAMVYCTVRGDHKRLQHYKAIAVTLSHRLGLHHSQKRFSFGALTIETRKRVFWTLYTLDCFTAASLGLPKLLKEDDVQTEFPSDTDDDYVTEKGFQPSLPGEYTRISSALALFRGARLLARVLERNYPSSASYELSLQQMSALEADLDQWYQELPSHLRLTFKQDKPSTDVTGSRSPLIALVYYHIRTLIWRPAVGSSLGSKAAQALISIGDASKHMIQIIQLLDERSMTFSLCLNRGDVLALCGMTLLYQTIDLKQDGRLMREDERLVNAVLKLLVDGAVPGTVVLWRVAKLLITVDSNLPLAPACAPSPSSSTKREVITSPPRATSQARKKSSARTSRLASICTASESDLLQQQEKLRRMTMPTINNRRPDVYRGQPSRSSFDSLPAAATLSSDRRHQLQYQQGTNQLQGRRSTDLDFLSFNTEDRSHSTSPAQNRHAVPQAGLLPAATATGNYSLSAQAQHLPAKMAHVTSGEWEALLGSIDCGVNNVYNAIYGGGNGGNGGQQPAALNESGVSISNTGVPSDWSPDTWDLSNFTLASGHPTSVNAGNPAEYPISTSGEFSAAPQSVLSLSDDSLSSGEEIAPSELGLSVGSAEYNQILAACEGEAYSMEHFETFAL